MIGADIREGHAAMSQQDVATLLNMHRTRVSQIEIQAIRKLREAIQTEAAAAGVSPSEWLTADDELPWLRQSQRAANRAMEAKDLRMKQLPSLFGVGECK